MHNYLVFSIFVIVVWGLNLFIHRYLMNNWDYYRHLQKEKNPSPIELGIFITIANVWIFLIVLVLVFFFGDEWLF